MKQPRDHRDHLEDISHAARKALEFVVGMGYEDFQGDDRTVYAVVRALEIVGEATKTALSETSHTVVRNRCNTKEGVMDFIAD